ncbi:MAG: hypothetical protein ACK5MQ_03260 [Pikeienuella sp.]
MPIPRARQFHDARQRQRGFALLAALGLALALALVVAAALRADRVSVQVAARSAEAAETRAAAEAGVWRAATRMVAGAPDALEPWRFEGVELRFRGGPERGRTDLNLAGAGALAAAARAAGHPDPEGFAGRVLAARRGFAAQGLSWRLEARAFDHVGQARFDAPPALWSRLAEALTVEGAAVPDHGDAPPREGEAIGLRVEARHPAGARAALTVLMRLGPQGRLRVLDWRWSRPFGAAQ